jgi:1-aminocyclopropane-1-carboxylate deaminase
VIRGDTTTGTLQKAQSDGMQLYFVSREHYARKENPDFLKDLRLKFGDYFLVPEGGNNLNGIKGCSEITDPSWDYDYIFCACGTGATFTGLVAGAGDKSIIVGVSVLKGDNLLPQTAEKNLNILGYDRRISGNEQLEESMIRQHCIINSYAGKGYAKFEEQHYAFKNNFENKFNIPLDHVYTAKLFFAVNAMIDNNKFPAGARFLVVHSGGLQGNPAFEKRYNLNPTL